MELLGNSNSKVKYMCRLFQPTFYQSLNQKNFIYFGSFFNSKQIFANQSFQLFAWNFIIATTLAAVGGGGGLAEAEDPWTRYVLVAAPPSNIVYHIALVLRTQFSCHHWERRQRRDDAQYVELRSVASKHHNSSSSSQAASRRRRATPPLT